MALAIKDALRSGDLFLPQSKQHVSFWELMLSDTRWQQLRTTAADALEQPSPEEVKTVLPQQFNDAVVKASTQFPLDDFAEIRDGQLKLKHYDKEETLTAASTE